MDRALLAHLPAILAVARTRSFAKAAAELGLGASAVSHGVKTAEAILGEPLFARTTRSVSLTENGAEFVADLRKAFDAIDGAVERVRVRRGEIRGLLRINAPRVAGPLALTGILKRLSVKHPHLAVEVVTDDALTDMVAEGFDIGVRLGEMVAQDMIAVRLTPPFRAIVAAAPSYLKTNGCPKFIAELSNHNCIGFRLLRSNRIYEWDLKDKRGKDVSVAVHGTALVTDPTYARELALAGVGLLYSFEPLIAEDIAQGRLVEVLPKAAIWEDGLYAYFLRQASRTAKLRAFIELSRQMVDKQPGFALTRIRSNSSASQ